MKKLRKVICCFLSMMMLLSIAVPGNAYAVENGQDFIYLVPEEDVVPAFYETDTTITVEKETIPIYKFENTAGITFYRVYGEIPETADSTGFYGCDVNGTPDTPFTRYTLAQDETLRGKTGGNTMIADGGVVTSVEIEQFDGTASFDADDEVGHDSANQNQIVRSFDSIVYNLSANMEVNNGASGPDEAKDTVSFTGGTLYVKAVLPEELKGLAAWDTENMAWAQTLDVSEDKLTLTASYQMDAGRVTVPGRQSLNLPLSVYGAANGTQIQPSFKMWLEGNETDASSPSYEAVDKTSEITTVSAKPAFNIKLQRNTSLERKISTSEYGVENQSGRLYGYGIALQLLNDSERPEKDLKGLEFPTGDITFDLKLKVQRTIGTSDITDITSTVTPKIWNYALNGNRDSTAYPDRQTDWGNQTWSAESLPGGSGGGHNRVYDSGNYTMVPDTYDPGMIHVTVSDYQFNGVFPYHYLRTTSESAGDDFARNNGYFSVAYLEMFVPFEETEPSGSTYDFIVEDTNFSTTTNSGSLVTGQIVTTDDLESVPHYQYTTGSYIKGNYFSTWDEGTSLNTLVNDSTKGLDYARIGQVIAPSTLVSANSANSEYVNSVATLSKFDDEALEPVLVDGNGFTRFGRFNVGSTKMHFHMLYAVKPDGTGWNSDAEMYLADMEDLEYYDTYEEWKTSGKICVGVLFESDQTGDNGTFDPGRKIQLHYYTKVKDTALVGQVYQICNRVRLWYDDIDAENRWSLASDIQQPSVRMFEENEELTANYYSKTQYSESGNVTSGHRGNGSYAHYFGNSLRIVGATTHVDKVAYDATAEMDFTTVPATYTEKTTYDLDKNETVVSYALFPSIQSETDTSNAQKTTLTITDVLPSGLAYVPGSGQYQGTTIEPSVATNEETGATTLTWTLTDITIGDAVAPVTYQAELSQTLENGTDLLSKVTISAPEDNREGKYRENAETVQVLSLANHRLYKDVQRRVFEVKETFSYDIHYKNNTQTAMSDVRILDVLPYNGDERGTSYHGTYALSGVVAENATNVTIYYTTNQSWKDDGKTAADVDLTETAVWQEYTAGDTVNGVTAIVVKGDVAPVTVMDISVTLTPSDNKMGDVYGNDATMMSDTFENPLIAVPVSVVVVSRSIAGKAWIDANANGRYDFGEELLQGISVSLRDEDGNPVTDVNGNPVAPVTTGSDGSYLFENLPEGTYQIYFIFTDTSVLEDRKVTTANKEGVPEASDSDAEEKIYTSSEDGTYVKIAEVVLPKAEEMQVLNYVADYQDAGIAPITGSISLLKTDEKGNALADVSFDLYKEAGETDEYIGNYRTDANGRITVENLVFGSYYFVEKEGIAGYEWNTTPTSLIELTSSNAVASNTTPLEIRKVNRRKTGTLVFTKVDDHNQPIKVEGTADRAAFALKSAEDETLSVYSISGIAGTYVMKDAWEAEQDTGLWWPGSSAAVTLVDELITDADGEIHIQGLPWSDGSVKYKLVETKAPTGYKKSSDALSFRATVNAKNEVVVSNADADSSSLSLVNTPYKGNVVVAKQDENGNVITSSSAKFIIKTSEGSIVRLKPVSDGVYELSDTESENSVSTLETKEGKMRLLNLPWTVEYQLIETESPEGYDLDSTPTTFRLTYDAEQNQAVYNGELVVVNQKTFVPTGTVAVKKTDRAGNAISGVIFDLYKETGDIDTYIGSYSTGDDGCIRVSELALGSYYFVETMAKPGYQLDATPTETMTLDASNYAESNITPLEVTKINHRVKGGITIAVIDEANEYITSDSAWFVVKDSDGQIVSFIKTEDGKYERTDTDTTDCVTVIETKDAKVVLSNLDSDVKYTLSQTEAPSGYYFEDKLYGYELNYIEVADVVIYDTNDDNAADELLVMNYQRTGGGGYAPPVSPAKPGDTDTSDNPDKSGISDNPETSGNNDVDEDTDKKKVSGKSDQSDNSEESDTSNGTTTSGSKKEKRNNNSKKEQGWKKPEKVLDTMEDRIPVTGDQALPLTAMGVMILSLFGAIFALVKKKQ
ncbi:MAG: collagen binding domain-containing protein [Lachnospiraceae bacterium]